MDPTGSRATAGWAMVAAMGLSVPAWGGETPRAKGASVYFVTLADGDTVTSPVKVVFGLSGMGVAPAEVDAENTGHHHLLVDRPAIGERAEGAEAFEHAIPSDANNIHFGKGQTETVLDLAPGPHTLQLVLGDPGHVPHADPVVSGRITITVE